MAKYKFKMHISAISGDVVEIINLPDDITEKELAQELNEWIYNEIDCFAEKIENDRAEPPKEEKC